MGYDTHNTWFLQIPTCTGRYNKRPKRQADDEGLPATIEVFSGLYVNENAEVLNDDADSVFKERVTLVFSIQP